MIQGVVCPRTQCNSVECLAQMIVRIKPIIEKTELELHARIIELADGLALIIGSQAPYIGGF